MTALSPFGWSYTAMKTLHSKSQSFGTITRSASRSLPGFPFVNFHFLRQGTEQLFMNFEGRRVLN